MSLRLIPAELEFIREARQDGHPARAGLLDVTCFLERHGQDPDGLISLVEFAQQRNLTFEKAEEIYLPRPDRRSIVFGCGDCDQIHEIYQHHCRHIDCRGHMFNDNGGAILLDREIGNRAVPGHRMSDYLSTRIAQTVDMKFGQLPAGIDPEFYPYYHLVCGEARRLRLMAWDSTIAACNGKRIVKRISTLRRQARRNGKDLGRPFKVCLMLHVDYDGRCKRTYVVRRQRILPLAFRYRQQQTRFEEHTHELISQPR